MDATKKVAAVASGGLRESCHGQVYQKQVVSGSRPPLLSTGRGRPCPVCGQGGWCSVAADGAFCICMRVESGSVKRTRNGGFLHRLREERQTAGRRWTFRTVRRVFSRCAAPAGQGWAERAESYANAASPPEVEQLATSLGLSPPSLRRLSVGWALDAGTRGVWDAGDVIRSNGQRIWSFPMRDAAGRVLGIRLRAADGRKYAVAGGREGLFIPNDLPNRPGQLLIAEGPTDTAALLDLGLAAVGRPSCTGGVTYLVRLVQASRADEVVVVADADAPGQRGAEALAATLVAYVPRLRVIAPPHGVRDARAWLRAGATVADLNAAIKASPIRSLTMGCRNVRRGRRGAKGGSRGN